MASSQTTGLRAFRKTPIFLEEDHHDVLHHILRAVGAKRIPLSGNALVHFDSHPDLLLPHGLTSEEALQPRLLAEKLSIENWILPAAYMGVFDLVVWICPPWADQIPAGLHSFQIGRRKSSGEIAVTCLESYFLSETIACGLDELDPGSTRDLKLFVLKVRFDGSSFVDALETVLEDKPFVLDIDLDFYSTSNPFAGLYEKAGFYETLKTIYVFDSVPRDVGGEERIRLSLRSCRNRKLLLAELRKATSHLKSSPDAHAAFDGDREVLHELLALKRAVAEHYGEDEASGMDWDLVHDAGCTCDDTELPDHVSTPPEISMLMELTKDAVESLKVLPSMITVARSSLDGYCPPDQVEAIQGEVLKLLAQFLSHRNVDFEIIHGYL